MGTSTLTSKDTAEKQYKELYQHIVDISEGIVLLYDDIEDFFFQDVDFQKIKHLLPPWVIDAGRCPESTCSKVMFEKIYRELNDPITNRCLHWYDLQTTIAAMQDRLLAVNMYIGDLKKIIPLYCTFLDKDITGCSRDHNEDADRAYTSINNVFSTLNSALDLFAKIMYECQKYDPTGFAQYKGLKSRIDGVLFRGCEKRLPDYKIPLSAQGLVFSKPVSIEKMYSYRDEYIHNGAWDYRCSIYYPLVKGEPAEAFILGPDIDGAGNFEKYAGRNKFYSNGEKINVTIMPLVEDIVSSIEKSILAFRKELQNRTVKTNKDAGTKAYFSVMQKYRELISKDFDNRSIEELRQIAPGWLTRV